ncbi:putative tyrosine-protein kinase [Apostichopus japonicus]|uniref:Putative tyrosine-protein kinase n=1 Tax=Stichopus japonicus TaxID=307972 RepID=A0A2G8JYG6_STIJA|nr:putative tyrosine-protein kinase [Apostichopus japonicus]
MVTTHPFQAESSNPFPQYYCYLSSLDSDAVVSSRRVLETRRNSENVDRNPAPSMPVRQQGDMYPPGSAVYKVTLNFGGTNAYGTFSCDASRSGRADSTVSNILMNSGSYTYPEDGLVTQTVNMDDRGVEIRMAGAQDVNRWHRNTLNVNILSNPNYPNYDFTGMNLILNFKLNISKIEDEGLYQTLSDSLNRLDSRHGLKRLIVRSCPSNHWAPPTCYGVCDNCYNGGVCDDKTGRCICPPGFMGANCLTACNDDQFGLTCEFRCTSDGCKGLQFCLLDPYGCSCGAGWKGLDCLTVPDVCPVGYYGPNCTSICNCRNGDQCDTMTGECPNQHCGPGYMVLLASVTCQECQGDYFGQLCQEECHCVEEACNKLNGQCCGHCKPQWVDASQCLVGFEEATSSKINPGASTDVSCVLRGSRRVRAGLSLHLSREEAQIVSNGIQELTAFSVGDVYTGEFRADNVTDKDKVFCLVVDQEDEIVAVLSTTVNEYVLPVLTSPPSLLHVNVSLIAIQWSAWDAVKDMGEPPIVAYIPYYRKMSTKEWIAGPINNTSLTFTAVNLDSDTLYVFSVAAVREGEKGEGTRSPGISFRTHCDVSEISPVDVVVYLDVTSNAVNVSWQIPEDIVCTTGISFFNIYVEEVGIDGNPQLHKRIEGDIHWAILENLKKGYYTFLVTFTIDTESDFSETSEVISIVEDLAGTPDAKGM